MEVIKREGGHNDIIKFSLRIFQVNREDLEDVSRSLSENYEIIINEKSMQGISIMIKNLDEYQDYSSLIKTILEFKNSFYKVNFFFALNTSFEMSGFTVHAKISNLYKQIGDSMDFSVMNYG